MNPSEKQKPFVAIACGGTGGHLFPGMAVGGQLQRRGCDVALLISPKEIDQQGVKAVAGMEVATLPAVGLQNRNYFSFIASLIKSSFATRKLFRRRRPDAVLAMGGFTSAPPVWVGKKLGARIFLHESNTVPGRANRYLARLVDTAFTGFPETAGRLKARRIVNAGTPVRPQFSRASGGPSADECRTKLGLDPGRPTVLVVGGSQGASGLNEMVLAALPLLSGKNWQWLHLTGAKDFEKVQSAYARLGFRAVVKPFLGEMDVALGAATAGVSRAGASSLAEVAAMRLPVLLVPFPAAADNHQSFNADAFQKTGAARCLEQRDSTPEKTAAALAELMENESVRMKMGAALAQWHAPNAADEIADAILTAITRWREEANAGSCGCGCAHGGARHAH